MGEKKGPARLKGSVICSIILIQFVIFSTPSFSAVEEYSVHVGPYGYAPFFIVDRTGGEITYSGIAHDLLDYFERENPDYNRTHILLTRKRVNTLMVRGAAFDLMFNSPLFVTPDILKHYQFSNTLLTSKDVVVTRKEQALDYLQPSDLYGMSVGAIRGYSYGEFDRLFSQGSISDVRVDDHKQAIGMLAKKRIDAYLGNIFVSPYYMKEMGLEPSDFEFSKVAMYEIEFGFLVNKQKPELLVRLNDFIDKVLKDGSIDKLIKKYLD